jgi:hypothetical protein
MLQVLRETFRDATLRALPFGEKLQMAYKARLRRKSDWQQDDCIGWWIGCRDESVEEAVYEKAAVRCCRRERCMLFAVKLAVDQGRGYGD